MNENLNDVFEVDELEDFEANEEITYLVCALGYSEDDEPTDCEVYLEEFEDPADAIAFAKQVTLGQIIQKAVEQKQEIFDTSYFSLEVETVVMCEDPEDGTENIDTVWETVISID